MERIDLGDWAINMLALLPFVQADRGGILDPVWIDRWMSKAVTISLVDSTSFHNWTCVVKVLMYQLIFYPFKNVTDSHTKTEK